MDRASSTYVEEYRKALSERAPKTISTYEDAIDLFTGFIDSKGWSLTTMPPNAPQEWVAYMRKRGDKPNSIRSRRAAVVSWASWLKRQQYAIAEVDWRPKNLPKIEPKASEPISPERMADFAKKAAAERGSLRMALLLLPLTGLRISELVQLQNDDGNIALERADGAAPAFWRLLITRNITKTAAGVRDVPIHSVIAREWTSYLKGIGESRWLFPSPHKNSDGHMSAKTVQNWMRENVGTHPHAMRHQFRYYLGLLDLKPKLTNRLMGHADATMGEHYDKADRREKFEAVNRIDVSWLRGAI